MSDLYDNQRNRNAQPSDGGTPAHDLLTGADSFEIVLARSWIPVNAEASLDKRRSPTLVQACQDAYPVRKHCVEEGVGKARDERTARVAV